MMEGRNPPQLEEEEDLHTEGVGLVQGQVGFMPVSILNECPVVGQEEAGHG